MVEASFNPTWISKPGDTLAVLMHRQNLSAVEVAALIDTDLRTVRGVIAGHVAIDDRLAEAIAAHIGGSTQFWRKRQSAYDVALHAAVQRFSEEDRSEWLKAIPIAEIAQFAGTASKSHDDILATSLAYFGVCSSAEWQQRYASSLENVAFRTSKAFMAHIGATATWLRQGEVEASMVTCKPWSAENLSDRLGELRRLSLARRPAYFLPRVQALCAEAGVAVVVVKPPQGCRASGATRFIAHDRAMINLSFRYRSDDHFWFTLFHEIGHLIRHGQSATFVDSDETAQDAREQEANAFAAEVLIPAVRQEELRHLPARREKVLRFAASLGISPGIVVGQAQYRKYFAPRQFNYLKRRFEWPEIEAAIVQPVK